jgi:hypothetical protein
MEEEAGTFEEAEKDAYHIQGARFFLDILPVKEYS